MSKLTGLRAVLYAASRNAPLNTSRAGLEPGAVGSVADLWVRVNMEAEVLRFARALVAHGLGATWEVRVRDEGERIDIKTERCRYKNLDPLMFSLVCTAMEDTAVGAFDDEELSRTLSAYAGVLEDVATVSGRM